MSEGSPQFLWLLILMAGVLLDLLVFRFWPFSGIPGSAACFSRLADWLARKLDRARRSKLDRGIRGVIVCLFILALAFTIGREIDQLIRMHPLAPVPAALLVAITFRLGPLLREIHGVIRKDVSSPARLGGLIRHISDRLSDGLVTGALALGLAGFTGLLVWTSLVAMVRAGAGTGLERPASPFYLVPAALYQIAAIAGATATAFLFSVSRILLRRKGARPVRGDVDACLITRHVPLAALTRALDIRLPVDPDAKPGSKPFIGASTARTAITARDLRAARLILWTILVVVLTSASFVLEQLT